jgi:hypothetical protein
LSQVGSNATCRFLIERLKLLIADQTVIGEVSREAVATVVLEAQANLRLVAEANGATMLTARAARGAKQPAGRVGLIDRLGFRGHLTKGAFGVRHAIGYKSPAEYERAAEAALIA